MSIKREDMGKKYTEAKKNYINEWNRQANKAYHFRLNKDKDADMIDYMERQPNKQGFLKDLIRAAMESEKS